MSDQDKSRGTDAPQPADTTGGDAAGRRSKKRQPDLNSVYSINADGSRNFLQVADVRGR